MNSKKIIALALAVIIILSVSPLNIFIDIFAALSPYDSVYGKGTYSDPADYRQIHPKIFKGNGADDPIAKFSVIKTSDNSIIATSSDPVYDAQGNDTSKVITVSNIPAGTTIRINSLSTVGSGSYIDMVDFQVTKDNEQVETLQGTLDELNEYRLSMNTPGTYNFYLCVRDNTPKTKTDGWGNWSYNGQHQSTGLNHGFNGIKETTGTPETAGGDDFWGYWYYAQVRLIVTSDATALFTVNHNNNNITNNQENPLLKSATNRTLVLQDESVQGTVDPITTRTWYYWNVSTGWTSLSGKTGVSISSDSKTVTINDYDSNLPNSNSTSKSFKLETTTQSGFKAICERHVYFRYGSIVTYYKDVDTNTDVHPLSYNNNLMANTYPISAKAAPSGYTLLTASPQSVTLDQSNPDKAVTFYYKKNMAANTGTIVVQYKDKKNPTVDVLPTDNSRTDVSYGTYVITAPPAPSGYIFDSSANPSPQTVTLSSSQRFVLITFYYMPAGSGGKPPIAVITGPSRRMAGESITFSGGSSIDPDGTIVNYIWNIPGSNHIYTEPSGKTTRVWYPEEGEYGLDLTVEDNSGMTGDCITTIEITPPVPTAAIDITGKPKENRKITVSGSNSSSPTYYPINKYTWTMTNSADARYVGSFGSDVSKDMILKKAQSYRFDLRVNNTYGLSDTELKTITITPDVAPTADFSVATQVLRNPNDSNYATITAANLSKSTDGDTIKKTVMFYAYDSDNDGNFDEETWYICKNGTAWAASGLTYAQLNSLDLYNLSGAGNPSSFVLKTQNVGKYKFEAKTIEDIPAADTIPSLLVAADYKTGITTASKPNSAKIVEVINTAPTVSFEVRKKKPADIFIFTDYTGDKLNGLQSAIAAKKAQLSALGVDANFVIVNSSKNVGSKTVNIYKFRRDSGMAFHKVEAWGPYGNSDNGIEYQLAFTDEIETYDQNPLDMPAGKLAVSYGGGTYYDTSDKNPSYYSQGYRYTVYDNQGGSYPVSFATYRVQGAYHWEVRDWHIEGVYNGNWIRDSGIIRTDTYNATSIDLDKILTQTLRSGSDRYAFFLSDASSFDYSQSFGSTFAFGSLTDTINNYIKSNGFKVSVIASPAAVDNNLICEKVTDIVSTGCYGFYTTPDGKTKSLGTLYPKTSGEPVYPYDRGTNFGKIREGYTYADYNYVYNYLIMQNGTVKKQSGQSDVFTTIPGLTGIVKKIGPYFLRANGDCYAENGRLVATGISAVGNDKPMHIQFNKNSVYYEYDILLCSNGTMIAVSPDYTTTYPVYYEYYTYDASGYYTGGPYYTTVSGVKDITDRFFIRTNGDVIPKMGVTYYNNKIMFHEGFHPNYYTRPGRSNIATGVSSIKENGNIVIFTMANGSKKMAFYGRTYRYSGGEFRDWVYTMSPVTDLDVVSGYSKDSLWENGTSLNYMLTADGNLRRYEAAVTNLSGLLNAPVILSNVRYYDGLIAITNDDKVYSAIGTNVKLLSISNVDKVVTKEYFAAGTSNSTGQLISYILTKDNTLYAYGYSDYGQIGYIRPYLYSTYDAVIPNSPNITLNQPSLNYLTLRDVLNASPDNRYYATGQYAQALTDLAASYTSDPSYSTNYILVGDTVDYKVIYQDFELDPNYRYYWTYDHQSNYFENSLGLVSFHGQTLSAPVTTFDKVGKYTINLKVRDNPRNNDLFDNYRLYNQGVVTATLYVHRKPFALIDITLSKNGEYLGVSAVDGGSYDLDHTSRVDKGIVAREWSWRDEFGTWQSGQLNRNDLTPDRKYFVRLRVKDLEGFWSDYEIYEIDPNSVYVDAVPKNKTWTNANVNAAITAFCFNSDIQSVRYCWTQSTTKPASGWTTDSRSSFTTTQSTQGVWYLHMEAFNAAGNSFYRYRGPYQIDKTAPAVDCTPTTKNSNTPYSVSGTASDTGGSGLRAVYYQFTSTTAKPTSGWISSAGSSFTLPVPDGGIWYLHMEVFDNAGNSFYRYRGPFIYVSNRPPTVTISRSPAGVLYDDDSVTINFTPADPDAGQLLNVVLEQSKDGSAWIQVYSRSNVPSGQIQSYVVNSLQVGTYTYRATATDPFSEQAQASLSFTVVVGYRLSDFRVSIIRDFHLESYYNDGNGRYPDKPFFVNDMALDPDTFIVAGINTVPGFTSLTKGYIFEFEIDSKNFNDSADTIVINPTFYAYYPGVPATRGTEIDLYWEDSNHTIHKAGHGGHDVWNILTLTSADRKITSAKDSTWRGEYLIPGTSWAVPKGTSAANALSSKMNADIIVNFRIRGYKNGVMRYDYNLEGWPIERTVNKIPYQVGDVIRYDHTKNNMDDIKAYRKY